MGWYVLLDFALLLAAVLWPRSRVIMMRWLEEISLFILRRMAGRPLSDPARIRQLERDLRLVPGPETQAPPLSLPVRDSGEDLHDDIFAWGAPSPVRVVHYPRDPAPRMPERPRPQIERK